MHLIFSTYDFLITIFDYLDLHSFISCRRVNKLWYELLDINFYSKKYTRLLEIKNSIERRVIPILPNGLICGILQVYNKNVLTTNLVYFNGKKNGDSLEFYPDGSIYSRTGYINDIIKSYTSYHNNGNIFVKRSLKNGLPNGKMTVYFANGKVSEKSWYKDGIKIGLYTSYFSNGRKKENTMYKNGMRHNWSYVYSGRNVQKILYKNDMPIKYE